MGVSQGVNCKYWLDQATAAGSRKVRALPCWPVCCTVRVVFRDYDGPVTVTRSGTLARRRAEAGEMSARAPVVLSARCALRVCVVCACCTRTFGMVSSILATDSLCASVYPKAHTTWICLSRRS
ncbi:hypothetical protein GCM10020220_014910 [Nonomuraea rubra]